MALNGIQALVVDPVSNVEELSSNTRGGHYAPRANKLAALEECG